MPFIQKKTCLLPARCRCIRILKDWKDYWIYECIIFSSAFQTPQICGFTTLQSLEFLKRQAVEVTKTEISFQIPGSDSKTRECFFFKGKIASHCFQKLALIFLSVYLNTPEVSNRITGITLYEFKKCCDFFQHNQQNEELLIALRLAVLMRQSNATSASFCLHTYK